MLVVMVLVVVGCGSGYMVVRSLREANFSMYLDALT